MLPNQPNGHPDYLQSGADNTLRGIGVFNALRGAHADNPLSQAWAHVVADPLVGPVAAHRNTMGIADHGFRYDVVRSLFLTLEASRRFIAALDRGASLAEGDPRRQAAGSRQAGFYVSGDDFVHWNRNGRGLAFLDGQWRNIDPDALTRVRTGDGATELHVEDGGRISTLMRVDPRTPALRPGVVAQQDGLHDAWGGEDRALVGALRERMGPAYSDEQVLAMVQRARQAGFRGPQAIEMSCVDAGTFFMRGDHTAGYSCVRMGIDELVPSLDELLATSRTATLQLEQARDIALESPRMASMSRAI